MPRIATTTSPLNAAATWTATIEAGLADRLTGSVFADQAGTIYIEQSGDNTNWDISTSYAITASDGSGIEEDILLPYIRIRFVNGATNQGVFRVFTRLTSAGPR